MIALWLALAFAAGWLAAMAGVLLMLREPRGRRGEVIDLTGRRP